jgi:calcineurin-like phosphoesterase family protein
MTIFFTSDQHWGHHNIIDYCHRPFDSVKEMDEAMAENWKDTVRGRDTIYLLGDVAMSDGYQKLVKSLPGTKYLIFGNHDKKLRKTWKDWGFLWAKDVHYLRVDGGMKKGGDEVWLSHYAHLSWNKKFHGSLHAFGHSHGGLKNPSNLSCDVGVDSWNFTPVSLEGFKEYLKSDIQEFKEEKERYTRN